MARQFACVLAAALLSVPAAYQEVHGGQRARKVGNTRGARDGSRQCARHQRTELARRLLNEFSHRADGHRRRLRVHGQDAAAGFVRREVDLGMHDALGSARGALDPSVDQALLPALVAISKVVDLVVPGQAEQPGRIAQRQRAMRGKLDDQALGQRFDAIIVLVIVALRFLSTDGDDRALNRRCCGSINPAVLSIGLGVAAVDVNGGLVLGT